MLLTAKLFVGLGAGGKLDVAYGAKRAKKKREKPEKGEKGSKGAGKKGKGSPSTYGTGYRLNVKYLTAKTADTNEKFKALFEQFGSIADAQLKFHPDGKSKGFGFVIFAAEGDATKAVAGLHGKELDGQKLFVGPAERREEDDSWGKGKGKGKQQAMFQAAQAAYMHQYTTMMQAYSTTGEQADTRERQGVLKTSMRYGVKRWFLVCPETYQYYGDHVNIEPELVPAGAKEGDSLKFLATMKFGDWDAAGMAPKPAKGYPKALSASRVQ